jgi:hypothetical protein
VVPHNNRLQRKAMDKCQGTYGNAPPLNRDVRRLRVSARPRGLFREWRSVVVTARRNVIVHIATSADGYIARSDGDLEWLTSRPAPEGFYGMNAFMKSIDTKVLGRKTYEMSLRMGAKFNSKSRHIVFSRHPPPADAPAGGGVRERCHRPICAPSARATWQGYMADGRRRDHRLLS